MGSSGTLPPDMYGTYRNRESYLQGSALLSNGTHTQRKVPTAPVRAAFEQRDGRDARKNARSGVDKDECHGCLPRATQVVRTIESHAETFAGFWSASASCAPGYHLRTPYRGLTTGPRLVVTRLSRFAGSAAGSFPSSHRTGDALCDFGAADAVCAKRSSMAAKNDKVYQRMN